MSGSILRWYDRCIVGLAVLAAATVLVMLAMIAGDVTSRTLGFGSWVSALPITELALLYFTVMSAPYLVRQKGHVAVDSFVRMLPVAIRRLLLRLVLAVCVLACLSVAWISVEMVREAVASGEMVMGGIDIPFWVYAFPLPLSYLLVATEFLLMMKRGDSPYLDMPGAQGSL